MRVHQHKFDIWDSKAKQLYKSLSQKELAMHADLLIREDCYLIQYIGRFARYKREMRHGDIVRKNDGVETYVVAWKEGGYIWRDRTGERAIWNESDFEVVGNKIEYL